MRTKVKWLDPLTQSAIVLVVGSTISVALGVIAIKTGNKNYALLTVLLVIIFAFVLDRATKSPGLIKKNEFDGEVHYKPEKGRNPKEQCDAVKLKNSNLPVAADGVNTCINPEKVFKLRNGTNVYIDKKGNVCSYSPVSARVNKWVSLMTLQPTS